LSSHLLSHHPPTAAIYTLSLHDALPILLLDCEMPGIDISQWRQLDIIGLTGLDLKDVPTCWREGAAILLRKPFVADELVVAEERSEEHTSELQSRFDLVCRLLLEKKKII